nr:hypothetical protein [uncultured Kingella sp.]
MSSSNEKLREDAIAAHAFSFKKHAYLTAKPQLCGCFCCCKIFPSSALSDEDFQPEGGGQRTAFCPYCLTDSVIGEESGYAITPELLQAMRDYWF